MLDFFILFLFFMFVLCELMKYKRVESFRLQTKHRLYNKKLVIIKFILLCAFVILLIVKRLFFGDVENSAGIKSVFFLAFLLTLLATPSIIDLRRVIKGYNEKLLEGISEKEDN